MNESQETPPPPPPDPPERSETGHKTDRGASPKPAEPDAEHIPGQRQPPAGEAAEAEARQGDAAGSPKAIDTAQDRQNELTANGIAGSGNEPGRGTPATAVEGTESDAPGVAAADTRTVTTPKPAESDAELIPQQRQPTGDVGVIPKASSEEGITDPSSVERSEHDSQPTTLEIAQDNGPEKDSATANIHDSANETQEKEQKDQPPRQKPTPDTSPGQPREARSEHHPDQDVGKQRLAALKQRLDTAVDKIKTDNLTKDYEQKIDQQIDRAADAVNPRYDRTKSAYSENCTGVVQAYELRRRGHDVQAGPLENHLRKDQGGPGGRNLSMIEQTWGGKFTPGSKAEIEEAFKQPGSRGVVYIRWHDGGAHVFNVENNSGKVRFVDGQPTPARYDVSKYFGRGYDTMYLRMDDRPDPPQKATRKYLES